MEALLKEQESQSRTRIEKTKATVGRRIFPSSSWVKKGLNSLGKATSGSCPSQTKIPELDYNAWGYALRAACASCLALYISFSLNLDGSHWAFTTCYIIGGERQNGRILAKSVARIVGTLIGAAASFALVNAFAHERVLFLGCFATWLSVCAFFSHYQPGHWAYAWVLSGYTMAIVGIPAALTPDLAFDVISSRAENVIIGILCMGTMTMIASPESVRPVLTKLVMATDQELFQLLSTCLSLKCDSAGLSWAAAKIAANAVSIEDLRHGFVFEETGTGFSRANLGRFHLECLDTANSAASLNAHLLSTRRLLENGELPGLSGALERSRQAVLASFHSLRDINGGAVYERLDQKLKQLQTSASSAGTGERQETSRGAELVGLVKVRCLLACLRNYSETRSALFTDAPRTRPSLPAKITTPMDISIAAIAVFRVFVTVGLASLFWIATAWPAGDTFLIWVGIACTRFVITPDPARATTAMFRGMVMAALPAYVITFYLLPPVDGFAMFVLVLFPFVFLGAGIAISLGRNAEVTAAMILLMGGLDPANEMKYDVVAFFNGVPATILGVGMMCLTHRLIFPSQPNHRKAAAAKRLTQWTVRSINQGKITGAEYLGSTVRMLNELLALSDRTAEAERKLADWAIDICALGYELVNLRQACDDVPSEVALYQGTLISAIADSLRQPSETRMEAVQSVCEQGYKACLQALANADPDSSSASHVACSLATFSVVQHRLIQQKSRVPFSVHDMRLLT